MSKVVVTDKQKAAIDKFKSSLFKTGNVNYVVYESNKNNFTGSLKQINAMTPEQIVLAWHGHVEVEPEFVSFGEAMESMRKGGVVRFHGLDFGVYQPLMLSVHSFNQNILEDSVLGRYTLKDLYDGRWTIERGENK